MARVAALTGVAWARAQPEPAAPSRLPWQYGQAVAAPGLRLTWRTAERGGRAQRCVWAAPVARDAGLRLPWGRGAGRAAAARAQWPAAVYLAASNRSAWGRYAYRSALGRVAFAPPVSLSGPLRVAWGILVPAAGACRVPWPAALGVTHGARLPWGRHWHPLGAPVPIVWDHEPDEPGAPIFVIPVRTRYLMLAEFDLVRLPDRLRVECGGMAFGFDADSRHWTFSATVLGRVAVDRVRPVGGVPVVVEATVQGTVMQAVIEDCTEDEAHGSYGAKISGRSLSAWLDAPQVLARHYTSTAALNAAQLAQAELPSGWTLDWSTGDAGTGRAPAPDWIVPAGAWSYQGLTPSAAVARLAEKAGCLVLPALAAQALRVQPRYPVLPWAWGDVDPDVSVPGAAILRRGYRQPRGEQANAVIVHGGAVGGVLGQVKRAGSAGDRSAETVSDALVTHVDAVRGWGGRILAAQADQPALRSLLLPFGGPDFPLLEVGQLLEVEDVAGAVRVMVAGVQVQVERAGRGYAVHQSLTLGEDSGNLWSAFSRLQPRDALIVATVTATHSDGTTSVQPLAGGTLRVLGSGYSVGALVYVRAGRIEEAAPALTAYPVEV